MKLMLEIILQLNVILHCWVSFIKINLLFDLINFD